MSSRTTYPFPAAARAVVLLVALAVVGALAPGVARAGEYHVYGCETPSGRSVPLTGLTQTALAGAAIDNTCERGGELLMRLGAQARSANEQIVARVDAASGTTIVWAGLSRVVRSLIAYDTGGAGPVFALHRDEPTWDAAHLLDVCGHGSGCLDVGTNGDDRVQFDFRGNPARSLVMDLACGGITGATCGASPTDRMAVWLTGFHFVLRDADAPRAAASGTALTGAALVGGETVQVSASDAGAGVRRARTLVDGQVVATRQAPGVACAGNAETPGTDLSYDDMAPCPRDASLEMTFDSAALADGARTVRIEVEDAAGNRTVAAERRVVIDNVPPPTLVSPPAIYGDTVHSGMRPGDKLTGVDGYWKGDGITYTRRWQRALPDSAEWVDIPEAVQLGYVVGLDDVGKRLRLVVKASSREGTSTAISEATPVVQSGATVSVASVNPGQGGLVETSAAVVPGPVAVAADGSPSLVLDREQRSVEVDYRARILVTGRLVDATTLPIGDADVDVFEQLVLPGAPWRKIATVRTDAQGGYAFQPETTGSRRLRFAYAAERRDGQYRAVREVTVSVKARMKATATRRVVRARGLISLKGRVTVRPFPASGTWVEIQVLDRRVWRTVGTRRTSKRGLWRFKHRLTQARGVTYRFRARLRPAADLPAAESRSKSVKVRVR